MSVAGFGRYRPLVSCHFRSVVEFVLSVFGASLQMVAIVILFEERIEVS